VILGLTLFSLFVLCPDQPADSSRVFRLNDLDYFEKRGVNVLVFSNWYNDMFSDSKMSGVEIIHHEVRTATNGDVRLNPTPEQWDPIPLFVERRVNKNTGTIEAFLRYPSYDFAYSVKAEPRERGIAITIMLEKPLPPALEGRAGFNLEFLPSAYFSWMAGAGTSRSIPVAQWKDRPRVALSQSLSNRDDHSSWHRKIPRGAS